MARQSRPQPAPSELLHQALRGRAEELAGGLGHLLGQWCHAKHKFGKGARQAVCLTCGRAVFVLPHGAPPKGKLGAGVPGLRGEAVFAPCQ